MAQIDICKRYVEIIKDDFIDNFIYRVVKSELRRL